MQLKNEFNQTQEEINFFCIASISGVARANVEAAPSVCFNETNLESI